MGSGSCGLGTGGCTKTGEGPVLTNWNGGAGPPPLSWEEPATWAIWEEPGREEPGRELVSAREEEPALEKGVGRRLEGLRVEDGSQGSRHLVFTFTLHEDPCLNSHQPPSGDHQSILKHAFIPPSWG